MTVREIAFTPAALKPHSTFQGTIRHWYVYVNFTNDITPLPKNFATAGLYDGFKPADRRGLSSRPQQLPRVPVREHGKQHDGCARVEIE